MGDNDGRLRQFISNLEKYCSLFSWNKEKLTSQLPGPVIIPMLQGTTKEVVWKICSSGFTTVATLDDGYYGKGIYFSSCVDYAHSYTKDNYFMLALVIPGNVCPVTQEPFNINKCPPSILSQMTTDEIAKKK